MYLYNKQYNLTPKLNKKIKHVQVYLLPWKHLCIAWCIHYNMDKQYRRKNNSVVKWLQAVGDQGSEMLRPWA